VKNLLKLGLGKFRKFHEILVTFSLKISSDISTYWVRRYLTSEIHDVTRMRLPWRRWSRTTSAISTTHTRTRHGGTCAQPVTGNIDQGPNLLNILRLSCDNVRITINFVRYASLAKSSDRSRKSKLPYSFPNRNL